MIVEFLDEARQELIEAALWYEGKEPGLGKRFRDEIAFVVDRISEEPFLWHERDGGYRRVNCPIFPYYLPYFHSWRKNYPRCRRTYAPQTWLLAVSTHFINSISLQQRFAGEEGEAAVFEDDGPF